MDDFPVTRARLGQMTAQQDIKECIAAINDHSLLAAIDLADSSSRLSFDSVNREFILSFPNENGWNQAVADTAIVEFKKHGLKLGEIDDYNPRCVQFHFGLMYTQN